MSGLVYSALARILALSGLCRIVGGLRTDDSQLAERLDALLALLELAGLDLDADSLQFVVKVRDGVLRARVVPDDEAAQRLAGLAAPCDGTLTLVRDTCRCETRDGRCEMRDGRRRMRDGRRRMRDGRRRMADESEGGTRQTRVSPLGGFAVT